MTDANTHTTNTTLAAAWRENLNNIRQHATQHPTHTDIPTPTGTITFTATHHSHNQITITTPITHNNQPITNATQLLTILTGQTPPPHLTAELTDNTNSLQLATTKHTHHTKKHHHTATTNNHTNSIELAHHYATHHPHFNPCTYYEQFATTGHHLHPCARTRLGWTPTDKNHHDLEATHPTPLAIIAAQRDHITATTDHHNTHIDQYLAHRYPQLQPHLHPDHILIPTHPWQLNNILIPQHQHLFTNNTLKHLPHLTIPAHPTSSIRTLITPDGTYLKCALDIHITSTSRGISPATAHNSPHTSTTLTTIINNDPQLTHRIAVLPEHASVSFPHQHPAARALTCLLRAPLSDLTQPNETPIPATALPATSPVTNTSVLAELIHLHATHHQLTPQHAATDFLTRYTDLLITATIHLAVNYGIGTEAHLQNCIPTFINGTPHRIILRDLGGIRIHLPTLHNTGHHLDLHPATITTTNSINTVHAKVSYTVFENHLTQIINTLHQEFTLAPTTAWNIAADTLHRATTDRTALAHHTADTLPTKALLHMRLNPEQGDITRPVNNPLAHPKTPPPHITTAAKNRPTPTCAYLYDLDNLTHRITTTQQALPHNAQLLYAMKANSHPAIVAAAAAHTDGIEIASGGELTTATTHGARQLIFSGPAKTDDELTLAITTSTPTTINVESINELRRLNHLAQRHQRTATIALRVNRTSTTPTGTHKMTGTPTPFGIDETQLPIAIALAQELSHVKLTGLHLHAVSNNLDAQAHADFIVDCLAYTRTIKKRYALDITTVNVGGGIGVDPTGTQQFDLDGFAKRMHTLPIDDDLTLVFELGRFLAAPTGWYVTEVLDIKHTHGRTFAVVRGGTHHFRLPAAWGYSHHPLTIPVENWPYPWQRPTITDTNYDITGELCTPRDVLARDVPTQQLRVGDLLVFPRTGAYGWDISHHQFLSHPKPEFVILSQQQP